MADAPLKILFCSFGVIPSPSGLSQRATEFIASLQDKATVDALTLKTADVAHIERYHGARLMRVPVGTGDLASQVQAFGRALERQLESDDYALVHCTDPFVGELLADLKGQHRFKLVYDACNLPSIEFRYTRPELEGDRVFMAQLRKKELFCLLAADEVLTGSDVTRDHLVSLGVPEQKVHVLGPAVNLKQYTQAALARPDRIPMRLIYLGSQVSWQGLPTLLFALRDALKQPAAFGLRLTLVGPAHPATRQELEQQVASRGLSGSVDFVDPPTRDELPRLLSQHDVGVAPLEKSDRNVQQGGLLMKVAEYAAAGRPMIVSDLPVTRALVDDRVALFHQAGRENALAAAMVTLASNPARRVLMGQAARALAMERFDAELSGEALWSRYQALTGALAVAPQVGDEVPTSVGQLEAQDSLDSPREPVTGRLVLPAGEAGFGPAEPRELPAARLEPTPIVPGEVLFPPGDIDSALALEPESESELLQGTVLPELPGVATRPAMAVAPPERTPPPLSVAEQLMARPAPEIPVASMPAAPKAAPTATTLPPARPPTASLPAAPPTRGEPHAAPVTDPEMAAMVLPPLAVPPLPVAVAAPPVLAPVSVLAPAKVAAALLPAPAPVLAAKVVAVPAPAPIPAPAPSPAAVPAKVAPMPAPAPTSAVKVAPALAPMPAPAPAPALVKVAPVAPIAAAPLPAPAPMKVAAPANPAPRTASAPAVAAVVSKPPTAAPPAKGAAPTASTPAVKKPATPPGSQPPVRASSPAVPALAASPKPELLHPFDPPAPMRVSEVLLLGEELGGLLDGLLPSEPPHPVAAPLPVESKPPAMPAKPPSAVALKPAAAPVAPPKTESKPAAAPAAKPWQAAPLPSQVTFGVVPIPTRRPNAPPGGPDSTERGTPVVALAGLPEHTKVDELPMLEPDLLDPEAFESADESADGPGEVMELDSDALVGDDEPELLDADALVEVEPVAPTRLGVSSLDGARLPWLHGLLMGFAPLGQLHIRTTTSEQQLIQKSPTPPPAG